MNSGIINLLKSGVIALCGLVGVNSAGLPTETDVWANVGVVALALLNVWQGFAKRKAAAVDGVTNP